MLFAETNRLEHACHVSVSRSLKEHIAGLRKALAALEAKSGACQSLRDARTQSAPHADAQGRRPCDRRGAPAYMPELGSFTKGEAACIAGLAPINKDSGARQAPRHIEAGRAAVRKTSI